MAGLPVTPVVTTNSFIVALLLCKCACTPAPLNGAVMRMVGLSHGARKRRRFEKESMTPADSKNCCTFAPAGPSACPAQNAAALTLPEVVYLGYAARRSIAATDCPQSQPRFSSGLARISDQNTLYFDFGA